VNDEDYIDDLMEPIGSNKVGLVDMYMNDWKNLVQLGWLVDWELVV
jgi:hypothetical protein